MTRRINPRNPARTARPSFLTSQTTGPQPNRRTLSPEAVMFLEVGAGFLTAALAFSLGYLLFSF